MKIIKIKYVDFWSNFKPEDDLIYEVLSHSNEFVVEFSDNPDYLIYSCFGTEHLKYDCIKIFYTGEEFCPDFNICDYAVGFDYLNFEDRYFRLPLIYIPKYRNDYNMMIERKYSNQKERSFCSFVYSNKIANPIRFQFYNKLSKYKEISSGGKILNNVGGPVENKLFFESNFKFSIAFENVRHNGYVTEKLMQSFAAGCVPIYWGDPCVNRMFNSKAFINISDFNSIDEAIEYIISVDKNDEEYIKMLNEFPINENYRFEIIREQFEKFINNIFKQDINEAKRTSREMWNKLYIDGLRSKERIYHISYPARKIVYNVQQLFNKHE